MLARRSPCGKGFRADAAHGPGAAPATPRSSAILRVVPRFLPWILLALCAMGVVVLPPPPPLEPDLDVEDPWRVWDHDVRPEPRPLYPRALEYAWLGATDWAIGPSSRVQATFTLIGGDVTALSVPLAGTVRADDVDLRGARVQLVADLRAATTEDSALAEALGSVLDRSEHHEILIEVNDLELVAAPRSPLDHATGRASLSARLGEIPLPGSVELRLQRVGDDQLEVKLAGRGQLGLGSAALRDLANDIWEHYGSRLGDHAELRLDLSLRR